jgi:hypothetical protein
VINSQIVDDEYGAFLKQHAHGNVEVDYPFRCLAENPDALRAAQHAQACPRKTAQKKSTEVVNPA